jgi:hypothetical protein
MDTETLRAGLTNLMPASTLVPSEGFVDACEILKPFIIILLLVTDIAKYAVFKLYEINVLSTVKEYQTFKQ